MIAPISLAPKSVLTVNSFIPCDNIPEDMSRVTISTDWFSPMASSDDIVNDIRWNGPNGEEPILNPIEKGVIISGLYYNVYDCNGTIVFYRKEGKNTKTLGEDGRVLPKNVILMYTDEATKIHVPTGKEIVAGVRYVRPTLNNAVSENAVMPR